MISQRLFLSSVTLMLLLSLASLVSAGEIIDAAADGNYARVQQLLKADPSLVGARSEEDGMTPLHLAAKGNYALLEFAARQRRERQCA